MPAPASSPESLRDVAELAALWNEILKGVRPLWGPIISSQQSALELIARADGRLRTREEWQRILWRVRASPYLMGQKAQPGASFMVMRPAFLLDTGARSGKPTVATRVELGSYDPEPVAARQRGGLDGVSREEKVHLDAQGLPWWPGRCQTGCSVRNCEAEGTAGFLVGEAGPMNPQGALCEPHRETFASWREDAGAAPPESPEDAQRLVEEWQASTTEPGGDDGHRGQLRASGG